MQTNDKSFPKSKYFNLEQITPGVFIAFSIREEGALGNAGIIDLGDQTLIYDTFENPIIARDLRVASEYLTGRIVKWVVNSHFHPDHWFGNQVFSSEATIISTKAARENMVTFINEVEEEKFDSSEVVEYIRDLKGQISQESDPGKLDWIKSALARWELYLESLPDLQLRLPQREISEKIEIHGANRYVELIDAGHAHTSGDLYLLLPNEGIAIIGDIGFFNEQPYMADSNPEGWKSILKELEGTDYETIIPGHGPSGTGDDLALIIEYIDLLEALVLDAMNQGTSIDDLTSQGLPEPFRTWSIGSPRFEINCQFMFDLISKSE